MLGHLSEIGFEIVSLNANIIAVPIPLIVYRAILVVEGSPCDVDKLDMVEEADLEASFSAIIDSGFISISNYAPQNAALQSHNVYRDALRRKKRQNVGSFVSQD
jgi:hypothetical protein